jgi:RNA polymerase sigma factor (sigma-70 family)
MRHSLRLAAATNMAANDCPSSSSMSDDRWHSALMNAAQAGDRTAYENLLRTAIPFIKMVVRRQGVPPDFVDDVVQETLLTVHRYRQTYDSSRPFMAWLRTIAVRRAIDVMRSQGRTSLREIHAPLAFENHPDPTGNPESGAHQADRKNFIGTALAALPAKQRVAVELLALGEKSPADAAAATGLTPGALKVNLHRALKTLRAHLHESLKNSAENFSNAEHAFVKSKV